MTMDQTELSGNAEQRQQIEAILRQLISEHLENIPPEDIASDIAFQEIGMDSFEYLKLLVELEDRFQLKISDEDFTTKPMDTLKDLVDLITNYQLSRGSD